MPDERKCGCKGIRTCLLCEKNSSFSEKSTIPEEAKCVYTYCPKCNLCWPDGEHSSPLFLDGVKIFPDFISEGEEADIVSDIDKIAWMPSQSGRRKQDFGPKVNFKKKKVRIGEFRGFPKFTSSLVQRFQSLPELSDFEPVELCHLEYTPERGSSIDPHVDDFWLWGERLVTINLGSPTVLTLVPCTGDTCDCKDKAGNVINLTMADQSCSHKLSHVPAVESSEKLVTHCNVVSVRNDSDFSLQNHENSNQNSHSKFDQTDSIVDNSVPLESILQLNSLEDQLTCLCEENETNKRTMCSLYRNSCTGTEVAVRVVLPARSLIVLGGCARYNWTHEIKRQDVVSRRLAMTFRELTPEFMEGGKEGVLGKELLTIANSFCDL